MKKYNKATKKNIIVSCNSGISIILDSDYIVVNDTQLLPYYRLHLCFKNRAVRSSISQNEKRIGKTITFTQKITTSQEPASYVGKHFFKSGLASKLKVVGGYVMK